MKSMNSFQVNQYITLKLEKERTKIYVNGKHISYCFLSIIDLDINQMSSFEEFKSVDEAIKEKNKSKKRLRTKIPPETEFWANCSNLQVWVENNYNTRLLRMSLAFPLLRELTEIGIPSAKDVFKNEIKKRFIYGFPSVSYYLFEEKYLYYLNQGEVLNSINELIIVSGINNNDVLKFLNKLISQFISNHDFFMAIKIREKIIEKYPQDFKEWQRLGHLYKNIGDYENALFAYNKALDANPSDFLTNLYIGKIFFKTGDKSKAEEIFWEIMNEGFSLLKYLDNEEKKLILKEFEVNEYIKLKLEKGQSNIYVKNRLFNQCKFLLINIPIDKISSFDEINSIDEAAEELDRSLEGRGTDLFKIPPEVEFWGHCSNLQVWAEMDYDTRLLHRNIAFPLLRELTQLGDPKARKVYKNEIIKRFTDGNETVNSYLIEEGYLEELNSEDKKRLVVEFIENEKFNGFEFLYSRDYINSRNFSKDEVVELLFDLNYDFNSFIKRFLKNGSTAAHIILDLLGKIPGGLLKDTEDLPQKLYKRGIIKIFIFGDNTIREYLTPSTGSGKFNYLEFACRDEGEFKNLINEIFQNKDIKTLRFLDSHNLLYLMFRMSKDELKEFIFDSKDNYQEFFRTIVDNDSDFNTIALYFLRELVEKDDSHAKGILKTEIIERLETTNLADLRYLIRFKDLETFTNEELRLISLQPLEDQRFLEKCTQDHTLFEFVFSLVKRFIENGFNQERNLLKRIFLSEFDKPESYLLKKLISGGYMEYLNENDKKEMIDHLIKTGNLNVFLELNNRAYIKLIDFQDELLTPKTQLNNRLMKAIENPEYAKKFAFPLLKWFAKKGTKEAQEFFNNQIKFWIKTGVPELLSFLKETYELREYFQVDSIKIFIFDEDSQFIDNVLLGLVHKIYSVRKSCFELFVLSLNFLDKKQRDTFIETFDRKTKYRGEKMPDTAFHGIQGLLMLGAFLLIHDLLASKGFYNDNDLITLKSQLRHYDPFPSSYRSDYDEFEEEDEYTFHTLQFLILFLDSREKLPNKAISNEEFKILHKFLMKSGEILDPIYTLNNFSKHIVLHLEDYIINKLSLEQNPQSFRKILEFINFNMISLTQLNTKEFFFKVLSIYSTFKRTNEKIYMNKIFIDYIFKIRKSLGDDLLDTLLKLFDEDFDILRTFIDESLNREYDISDEMREMAFNCLVLLIKSRNKEVLSTILRKQMLVYIDQDWLHKVFSKLEEEDLEYLLFGLTQISKQNDDYYHHYEDIGDETYLITHLKDSLNKRIKQEETNFRNNIIKLVILNFPELLEFLVEAEFFNELPVKEFHKLLEIPNNQFVKSILIYIKNHVGRNESFARFYEQVINDNLAVQGDQLISKLLEFYLDRLRYHNYEYYSISPPIAFFKKFGIDTIKLTFIKLKKWLNEEEYPDYQLFTSLINNDFLEIMDKEICLTKLKELKSELVNYLKDIFESKSYQTGYSALALIHIYMHCDVEDFIINLLKKLSKYHQENIKIAILNLIETNERKGYIYFNKLNSELKTTALKLVKLFEVELKMENIRFVTINDKKHYVIKKKLNLSEKNIYNIDEIDGLDLLTELKELDLSSNYITEIKGLNSLVNLESLNLDATLNEYKMVISEIKGLERLIKLKNLSLHHQKISEIKGLDKLTSLERLELNSNSISEIKNLEKLSNLEVLNLEYNKISEIKGLEHLKDLFYLNLSNNQIKEIKALDHLRNLESLWLSSNEISVLSGLENLYNLRIINVDYQRPGYSSRLSLDKSNIYYDDNGPKYVVHCLKKIKRKIKGTINCPNPDCKAVVYSMWDHCPICYKPIKTEKK